MNKLLRKQIIKTKKENNSYAINQEGVEKHHLQEYKNLKFIFL